MISIFIAEDQQMLLGALGSLLNLEDDMEVVGKVQPAKMLLILSKNASLMYVLWTLKCPEKQGLKLLRS